jgi:hypothetical protein
MELIRILDWDKALKELFIHFTELMIQLLIELTILHVYVMVLLATHLIVVLFMI